jgi:predicted thioesterase
MDYLMSVLQPEMVNETTHRVERRHLACELGSGLAAVLGTPALVAFCEECARLCVDPHLPEGQQTVGTKIEIQHTAATPAGMNVTVHAELMDVDGRRLLFRIKAHDEVEQIGEAEHERFVVDLDRFLARLDAKAARS